MDQTIVAKNVIDYVETTRTSLKTKVTTRRTFRRWPHRPPMLRFTYLFFFLSYLPSSSSYLRTYQPRQLDSIHPNSRLKKDSLPSLTPVSPQRLQVYRGFIYISIVAWHCNVVTHPDSSLEAQWRLGTTHFGTQSFCVRDFGTQSFCVIHFGTQL